jgi:histidine triad (HIT) family protein
MRDCIFCRIVNREVKSDVVFENDQLIAFRTIEPKARVHILIVPKKHIESLNAAAAEDINLLGAMIFTAKKIAEKENIAQSGYKLAINTGPDAGQSIPHLHLHLLGGQPLEGVT